MDSPSLPYRFPVRRCGGAAHRLLDHAAGGRVAAVFTSSFYLEAGGGYGCVGIQALGPGPLNILCDAPRTMDWPASGMQPGMPWRVANRAIHIGGRFVFPCDGAVIWAPPSPARPKAVNLRRALGELLRQATVPAEGLAMLVLPGTAPTTILHTTAEAPIAALHQWLTAAMGDPQPTSRREPRWVHPLIGLGPGLTPSGDDVIAGVMIALHGFGYGDAARQVWATAQPSAVDAGNPISTAHLAAAAEGQGSAAIHGLLSALLAGDAGAMAGALAVIGRIGHTSGWDALAGVVAVARSWLHSRPLGPTPPTPEFFSAATV
jgi:hypothetical protein